MDTEETKDIPDIVSALSETPSCHLVVDQRNVKVIEEPYSQEPSSQTSKGKSSSSVEENPNGIKMQVITSDISTVTAGQLTPVLNQEVQSEVLNKKVLEISGKSVSPQNNLRFPVMDKVSQKITRERGLPENLLMHFMEKTQDRLTAIRTKRICLYGNV